MQALLLFLYPVLSLPVLLAYLARYALDSDWAFWAVLGVVGVLAGVVYWMAMDSALAAAERRKEEIISALSEGAGPMMG
jgi:ABC-2 type transport system permease protein